MPVTLLASQVPIPTGYSGFLTVASANNDSGGNQPVYDGYSAGSLGGIVSTKLNKNAQRSGLEARYGGGAYAIGHGLGLADGGGLTVDVAAGHAIIDGTVELATTGAVVLPDNSTCYVWLKRDGTLTQVAGSLVAPENTAVFLGRVVTLSGSITGIDDAGRVELIGGFPVRETADVGEPGDTPGATTAFLAKTLAGLFLWDGSVYHRFIQGMAANKDSIASGETVYIPVDHQVLLFDSLNNAGTLVVAGKMRVIS